MALRTVIEDFSTADNVLQIEGDWTIVGPSSAAGTDALRSSDIGSSGSTTAQFTAPFRGLIFVEYTQSSEKRYDYLTVNVGGRPGPNAEGKTSGIFLIDVLAGQNIAFTYSKDGSGDTGEDAVFIRKITLNEVAEAETPPSITESNISGQIFDDFSSAENHLNLQGDWIISADKGRDGSPCLRSKDIGNGGTTSMSFLASDAGFFSFTVRVSSEERYDKLSIYKNDNLLSQYSGELPYTQKVLPVEQGDSVTFTYTKDGSASSGEDAALIDEVAYYFNSDEVIFSDLSDSIESGDVSVDTTMTYSPIFVYDDLGLDGKVFIETLPDPAGYFIVTAYAPVVIYIDFAIIGSTDITINASKRAREIFLLDPVFPYLYRTLNAGDSLAITFELDDRAPAFFLHSIKIAKIIAGGGEDGGSQTSRIAGIVQIDGTPAERNVRAFGYNPTAHAIDGNPVSLSKSLGHSTSDPADGSYTIDMLGGYGEKIFVVAFDDYGDAFTAEQALTVGDRIHPTTPNGHVFECIGAGSLPAEEPAWNVDTETAQLYGSASMIAKLFYRPMVQGPILPIAVETDPSPSPSYSSVILANNPVTYITFDDETADDISGNNNHAALIGNPITGNVSLVGGDNKLSVTLTGSEFIDLSVLAGTLSVQYTIEAWIKTTNDSTGEYGLALFSVHSSSYSNILRLVHNNDHLSLIKENGAEHDGAIIINDSQPHHIALVASGTDITVYIDGQVDIVFSESIVLDSAAYISVGQEYDPTGPSDYFQGTIDEIAVYESSLSPQSVADHYGARNLGAPV